MFNTLAYTKKLEAVGVIREQAETHVQIITTTLAVIGALYKFI